MGVIVVAVLLLVVMPMLIYLIGRGITRYTRKAPASIGFPAARDAPTDTRSGEPPARIKA